MSSTSDPQAFNLTEDWLTSRTFTFRVEPAGPTLSESFIFNRNGFIVGYAHDNEKFWELDGDTLRIVDGNGNATCILNMRMSEQGNVELHGSFRDPARDYAVAGSVHVLEENGSDYHARIQSFDLFDTLVARRCYDPLAVFRNVEAKSGIANFAARRHAVEMAIFGRQTYGLEDIYGLLVADNFLTPRQARVLFLMELEEEWDTLFPIGEVIAHVNPDDIIISDMYLPRAFIQRVLKEKCGLDNELYLSNYGKHHRKIWPSILEKYSLRGHFGDNLHADIVGASAFGIQPVLVTISKWNRTEEVLHSAGLGQYAHALRRTRLETFHRTPHIANALSAQLSVNIPLMLLGAFWIRYCVESFRADSILMASRDCNLWHEMIASAHFARCGMPLSRYINVSRTLCYEGTDAYEAYLRSNMGARSLLVDMVGTGRSMLTLVERLELGERLRPCILVADPATAAVAPMLDAFVMKDFVQYRIFIEGLNASLEGSAVAAMLDRYKISILSQPNEFSETMRDIITASRSVFQDFLRELNTFQLPAEFPHLAALRAAAQDIIEQLPEQAPKLGILLREQGENLAPASMAKVAVA